MDFVIAMLVDMMCIKYFLGFSGAFYTRDAGKRERREVTVAVYVCS